MPNQITNERLLEWYQRFARELREKVSIDVTQKADLGRVKNYAIKRWTPDDHGELVLEEPSFAFMPHTGTKPVNPAPTNVPFETYSQWLMDNLPEKVGIDQIRTLYEMSRAGTLMVSPPGQNTQEMRQVYTDENGMISTSMHSGWYVVKEGQPVPDEKKLPELPAFVEAPNPAKYGQPPEPPAPKAPQNMNPGFFSWLGYKLGFNTDYAKLVAYKEYLTEYPRLHEAWEQVKDDYKQNPEYQQALLDRAAYERAHEQFKSQPLAIMQCISCNVQQYFTDRTEQDEKLNIDPMKQFSTMVHLETEFLKKEFDKPPLGQNLKNLRDIEEQLNVYKHGRNSLEKLLGVEANPDYVKALIDANVYKVGEYKFKPYKLDKSPYNPDDYRDTEEKRQEFYKLHGAWKERNQNLYSLAALAALTDPDITGNPPIMGCTKEESAERKFTHLLADIFAGARANSQKYMNFLAPAREKGEAAVLAYEKEKKPETLGKMLGTCLRQLTREAADLPNLYSKTSVNVLYLLDRMLNFMENEPDLMKHTGLTNEELQGARAYRTLYQISQDGTRARKAIAEHSLYKRTLTPEELKKAATDILYADMIVGAVKESYNKQDAEAKASVEFQELFVKSTQTASMATKLQRAVEEARKNKSADLKQKEEAYLKNQKEYNIADTKLNIMNLRRPVSQIGLTLLDANEVAKSRQGLAQRLRVDQITGMDRESLGRLVQTMPKFVEAFKPKQQKAPAENTKQKEMQMNGPESAKKDPASAQKSL